MRNRFGKVRLHLARVLLSVDLLALHQRGLLLRPRRAGIVFPFGSSFVVCARQSGSGTAGILCVCAGTLELGRRIAIPNSRVTRSVVPTGGGRRWRWGRLLYRCCMTKYSKEEESNQQHSGIIHFFCFCHNHFRLRSRRRNKEIMEYLSGEKNQNASLGQTAKVLGWYS